MSVLVRTDMKGQTLFSCLAFANVKVKDVSTSESGTTFRIGKTDLVKAKTEIEKRGRVFEVVSDDTFSGFLKKTGARSGIFVGIVLFVAALVVCSLGVNRIEVLGNELVPTDSIVRAALSCVELPARKKDIKRERVENAICLVDSISSASVSVRGNTLFVTVLEELPETKIYTAPVVYSMFDAVVTKVVTLEGEAKVKEGDTVRTGDVLIEKTDKYANGEVYGRVWYSKHLVFGEKEIVCRRTGRSVSYCVNPESDEKSCPYSLWEKEESEKYVRTAVPMKIKKVTYYELEEVEVETDFFGRKDEIVASETAAIEKTLPDGCEKVRTWYLTKTVDKMTFLDIYYEIVTKISS